MISCSYQHHNRTITLSSLFNSSSHIIDSKMGKNKKRKLSPSEATHNKTDETSASNDDDNDDNTKNNPLYREHQLFLASLAPKERDCYFSETLVGPERRAELWMEQADIGEELVNKYAWATPTSDCLKIFRKFSPIVELGCGSNAYWTKYMKQAENIDVVAYDMNVREGGKIVQQKKKKTKTSSLNSALVRRGGAEVLKLPELKKHTLFLCYPDEEVADDQEDGDEDSQFSFGWQCLANYTGEYVIHVGELAVLGDATLNMEQSPWGRSSSSEFQQRLASEYHCIAKIPLPNWLHVRDSISVWKRSEICQMVFEADSDDEDDEDEVIEYRHIPKDEMLPTTVLAPCMEQLLGSPLISKQHTPTSESAEKAIAAETKPSKPLEDKQDVQPSSKEEQKSEPEKKNEDEVENKKSKSARRRERQKQKKMLLLQGATSENDDADAKKKEKKARSEYFRIHGNLPPKS